MNFATKISFEIVVNYNGIICYDLKVNINNKKVEK